MPKSAYFGDGKRVHRVKPSPFSEFDLISRCGHQASIERWTLTKDPETCGICPRTNYYGRFMEEWDSWEEEPA